MSIRTSSLVHCVRLAHLPTMCSGALPWQKIDQNRYVTAGSNNVPEFKNASMFFSSRLAVGFRRRTLFDPKLNLRKMLSEYCQASFLNMQKMVEINNIFLLAIERRFRLRGQDSFLQKPKHRTCSVY